MRQVGTIAELDQAERFADYLRAGGVACSVDHTAEGYRIWVREDDRVAAAKDELPKFLAEPNHQRYIDAGQLAKAKLREEQKRQQAARRNTVNLSDTFSRPAAENCPVTFALIAMSVLVGMLTRFDPQATDPRIDWLWFSNDGTLNPVFHGQLWRLFTPIFVHFGVTHLLFNMLWVYQFGLQLESRLRSPKFLGLVLVIALCSNFAEFWFQSASFGGMSGVVYGLFGYIWIRGKLDPQSGIGVSQQTVTLMLVWYFVCVIGWIPRVANWAHGGGLVTGIACAFIGSLLQPSSRRR